MERSSRQLPMGLSPEKSSTEQASFDLVKATGFWNIASIFVRFKNFFAHTLPPWPEAAVIGPGAVPTSPSENAELDDSKRPIASAVMVIIQSGEALDDSHSGAEPSSPMANRPGRGSGLTHDRKPSDVERYRNISRYSSKRLP